MVHTALIPREDKVAWQVFAVGIRLDDFIDGLRRENSLAGYRAILHAHVDMVGPEHAPPTHTATDKIQRVGRNDPVALHSVRLCRFDTNQSCDLCQARLRVCDSYCLYVASVHRYVRFITAFIEVQLLLSFVCRFLLFFIKWKRPLFQIIGNWEVEFRLLRTIPTLGKN